MNDVRIAMLGSGFVADFYMQGLANVKGQEVVVNYSRTSKRAKDFGRRWGIPGFAPELFVVHLPVVKDKTPLVQRIDGQFGKRIGGQGRQGHPLAQPLG